MMGAVADAGFVAREGQSLLYICLCKSDSHSSKLGSEIASEWGCRRLVGLRERLYVRGYLSCYFLLFIRTTEDKPKSRNYRYT